MHPPPGPGKRGEHSPRRRAIPAFPRLPGGAPERCEALTAPPRRDETPADADAARGTPAPTSRRVKVSSPVAVIASRFPVVTETFILRELDELERQGVPVVLVPLLRESPRTVHPEAVPWTSRAVFTEWL